MEEFGFKKVSQSLKGFILLPNEINFSKTIARYRLDSHLLEHYLHFVALSALQTTE